MYEINVANNYTFLFTYISIEWSQKVLVGRAVAMVPVKECSHTLAQLLSELWVLEAAKNNGSGRWKTY